MLNKDYPKQSWKTGLSANHASPLEEPGALRWIHDPAIVSDAGVVTMVGYGPCAFRYVRTVQSGGMTAGQLASYIANTAITNQTGTSATSITTSGLTASAHIHKLAIILDVDLGVGTPEGEVSKVVANTDVLITLDRDAGYSAALAANDDVNLCGYGTYVDDSAATDSSSEVAGVQTSAKTEGYWGWVQCYGIVAQADFASTTALEQGKGVIAGTAAIDDSSGSALNLIIGRALHAAAADLDADKVPFFINVLGTTIAPSGS